MRQKYTITIADIEINVITEESPEAVEALVGIVDRKMREIGSKSRRCSKTEAALLCALDYCSDKIKVQRKLKSLESTLAVTQCTVEELEQENEALRQELEELKNKA
ncbi:MAG: cell division protein ZapA [Clostridia bacterium]|nr:cell division protein ZapA [Clostridia bacterium]